MKCTLCKCRDAVYAIKTVINKRMRELRLCPECIAKKEEALGLAKGALMYYAVPIALTRLDKDIFPKDKTGLACPHCGLSWREAKEKTELGCGHCYAAFRPHLELFFRLTQGGADYAGPKYASPSGGTYLLYALLDNKTLAAEIADAVRREDFEKARALEDIRRRAAGGKTAKKSASEPLVKQSRAKTVFARIPQWMSGHGPYSHLVLFTAARTARNLAGYNFCGRLDAKGMAQVSALLMKQSRGLEGFSGARMLAAEPGGFGLKRVLAERFLLEGDPYDTQCPVTALLSAGQDRALVINDHDHAKFYAFESGFAAQSAAAKAAALADELGRRAPLSFSPEFGFHTAHARETGTGLRLFALVNLPALTLTGRVTDVLKNLPGLHLASTPLEPEGFALSGPLHIIASTLSLKPADDITTEFEHGLRFLITSENAARIELTAGPQSIRAEDSAFRALGILQNARSISYEETTRLLSGILLGLATGLAIPAAEETVIRLLFYSRPGHIAMLNETAKFKPGPQERDILRAQMIRNALAHIPAEPNGQGQTA